MTEEKPKLESCGTGEHFDSEPYIEMLNEGTRKADYTPKGPNVISLMCGGDGTEFGVNFKITCPCLRCAMEMIGHIEFAKGNVMMAFQKARESMKDQAEKKEGEKDDAQG